MQKSRVCPPLFGSNYFHKESTRLEKSAETLLFFMNTALYTRKESTHKKVHALDRYNGDFSPNYFEYRLGSTIYPYVYVCAFHGVSHADNIFQDLRRMPAMLWVISPKSYTANNFGLMYSRKRISQNSFSNFIFITPKSFMVHCKKSKNYMPHENASW